MYTINETNKLSTKNLIETIRAIHKKKCKIVENVNGVKCDIGIDENENFFIESNDFGKLTLKELNVGMTEKNPYYKNGFYSFVSMAEAGHIPRALKKIYESNKKPFKVEGVLCSSCTNEEDEHGDYVFENLNYYKESFGEYGTFIPKAVYSYNEGNWEDPKKCIFEDFDYSNFVLQEMYDADSSQWRVIPDTYLEHSNFHIAPYENNGKNILEMCNLYESKLIGEEERKQIKSFINESRDYYFNEMQNNMKNIESYFRKPQSHRKYIVEGVSLKLEKYSVDITNNLYKKVVECNKKYEEKVKTWKQSTKNKILNSCGINDDFNDVDTKLSSISSFINLSEEDGHRVLGNRLIREYGRTPQNFFEKSNKLLQETKNSLSNILKEWEKDKGNYHKTIQERNNHIFEKIISKDGGYVTAFEESIKNKDYKFLESLFEDSINYKKIWEKRKKKCLPVYVGKFQPWTKEHYNYLKEKFSNSPMCVVICDGQREYNDVDERTVENPFSFIERYNLIKEMFSEDENVHVSGIHIINENDVIKELKDLGYVIDESKILYEKECNTFNNEQLLYETTDMWLNKYVPDNINEKCRKIYEKYFKIMENVCEKHMYKGFKENMGNIFKMGDNK